MSKEHEMKQFEKDLLNLTESTLYEYRITNSYKPVIGEGSLDAHIVFIGEAPGKNEAESGKPFCGASGKVLDQLLESISLKREDVYITNIVKDRPQDNRDPKPEEIKLYSPFLKKQLEIIQPQIIVTLGRFSMEYILKEFGLEKEIKTISKIHGIVFKTKTSWSTIKIIPLYHPAVAVYNKNRLSELKKDFEILKK